MVIQSLLLCFFNFLAAAVPDSMEATETPDYKEDEPTDVRIAS